MKKILAVSMVLFSSAVFAADIDVCEGSTTATTGTEFPGDSEFVVSSFTPQCSANVFLSSGDSSTAIWVGSASAKGKTAFRGGSEGGGVSAFDTACASSGCTASDAQAARDDAALGSGS
ncbi:MAG: hypothetical protein WAO76_07205 [Georgfuchsia sp.]